MSELNFFSEYNRESRTSRKRLIIITVIFVGFLSLTVGIYLFTEMIAGMILKDVNSMQGFLNSAETQEKLKQVNLEKKKLEIMNKYYTAVDLIQSNLDRKDLIKSSMLSTFNTALPAEIVLQTVSIDHDKMQFSGIAQGWVKVAELEHNLIALGIFIDVHLTEINSDANDGTYTFTASCRLKEVVKK